MENLKKEILEWKKTDNYLKKKAEEETELKKLESFLNEFNIKKIEELKKDEYVLGKDSKESFCYKLEWFLSFFGSIRGGHVSKYILYWDDKKGEYSSERPKNQKWSKRELFGENPEEVFKNIKKYLLELINYTKGNDYRGIANHPFGDVFKNKISFLYSKNQLPIYKKEYVEEILKDFNINFLKKEDVIFKRQKLWDFYNENFKDIISPNLFAYFILDKKDYLDDSKKSKKEKQHELKVVNIKNGSKSTNNSVNFNLNTIFYGVPGTGKTFEANKLAEKITNQNRENIKFVTFHQSYEYEDFVEGIKAKTTKDNNIEYYIRNGIFKNLCETASKNKNEKFVIIIDEINRGNISKIFGELITLIEPSRREKSKFEIKTILPYSQKEFSVPSNLYIIGTMNTADRSITHIDSALRRRFKFIENLPDYARFENKPIIKDSKKIDISKLLKAINERIEIKYDRDHIIGHSYFLDCIDNDEDKKTLEENEKYENLKSVFKQDIIPMLQEYFFDDYNTIRFILNDNDTLNKYNFLKKKNYFEKDSKKYSEKELYEIDNDAFKYPESFIKIYENKKDNNDNDLIENKENESN